MSADVGPLIKHAMQSSQRLFVEGAEALEAGDTTRFRSLVETISAQPAVKQIQAAITSARASCEEFLDQVRQLGPWGGLVIDLTVSAMGWGLYGGAAQISIALAAAVGPEVLVVIGVLLMLIGALGAVSNVMKIIRNLRLMDLSEVAGS